MDRKSDWLICLVATEAADKTLFSFLQGKLSSKGSGRAIKQALERGACSLNGRIERFGSLRVQAGDRITFFLPKLVSALKPSPLVFPLLFEDDHLLFFQKPSGEIVEEKSIRERLGQTVFLVHRLDRATSGVIVVAKTRSMQSLMEGLFRKRCVEKVYFAVVLGALREKQGVIRNFLAKKTCYDGQAIWGSCKKGVCAITYWYRMVSGSGWTLLQCVPKTGRTHQLRAHARSLGHPILGDVQYGRSYPNIAQSDRLLLHAYSLAFSHPITKKPIHVVSPLPSIFPRKASDSPFLRAP